MNTNDEQFEDYVVSEVTPAKDGSGWSLAFIEGFGFWCPKVENGPVPIVGSNARQYGKGFGYPVRGLFIDGMEVFYRTEEEDKAKNEQDMLDAKQKRRDEYAAQKTEMQARIANLPQSFQNRITGFMKRNAEFGAEFLGYELFCCEQAIEIAKAIKTCEAVDAFRKLSYEEQRVAVPAIQDGHSGNTFGFSCRMAWLYLKDESLIEREHGALCPLVGCKEYGCQQAQHQKATT